MMMVLILVTDCGISVAMVAWSFGWSENESHFGDYLGYDRGPHGPGHTVACDPDRSVVWLVVSNMLFSIFVPWYPWWKYLRSLSSCIFFDHFYWPWLWDYSFRVDCQGSTTVLFMIAGYMEKMGGAWDPTRKPETNGIAWTPGTDLHTDLQIWNWELYF